MPGTSSRIKYRGGSGSQGITPANHDAAYHGVARVVFVAKNHGDLDATNCKKIIGASCPSVFLKLNPMDFGFLLKPYYFGFLNIPYSMNPSVFLKLNHTILEVFFQNHVATRILPWGSWIHHSGSVFTYRILVPKPCFLLQKPCLLGTKTIQNHVFLLQKPHFLVPKPSKTTIFVPEKTALLAPQAPPPRPLRISSQKALERKAKDR